MATAIVFKSESADYYLFAIDKDKVGSVKELKELLNLEWYISEKEAQYVESFTTDLDYNEVKDMISELLEVED